MRTPAEHKPTRREILRFGGAVVVGGLLTEAGRRGYIALDTPEAPKPLNILKPEALSSQITHEYPLNYISFFQDGKFTNDASDTTNDKSSVRIRKTASGLGVVEVDIKASDITRYFLADGDVDIRFTQTRGNSLQTYETTLNSQKVLDLLNAENSDKSWSDGRLSLFAALEEPVPGQSFDNVIIFKDAASNASVEPLDPDQVVNVSNLDISFWRAGYTADGGNYHKVSRGDRKAIITFFDKYAS